MALSKMCNLEYKIEVTKNKRQQQNIAILTNEQQQSYYQLVLFDLWFMVTYIYI